MIFGGITCNVYDKVQTVLSTDMKLVKESNGRPRWYDLGKEYDNIAVSFLLTASGNDIDELEALFREQETDTSISVTFQNDEWLYDTTVACTIQSWKRIDKIDRGNSEWGYEVKISPVDSLDLSALSGDRTECTGSGYISYSNTSIPQPKVFEYKYNTKKYTGLTHGSSYSDELPTNTYDSTRFKVLMNSGNLRALIDDIYTARGLEFFVDFPENTDPFGLANGTGNKICLTSTPEYTFTHENGDYWSIDLGLYYIDEGQIAPVFTVQPTSQTTTEGGSVTFGAVSVTGTPTPTLQWYKADAFEFLEYGANGYSYSVSDWTVLGTSSGITYTADDVTCASTGAPIHNETIEKGKYTFCRTTTELQTSVGTGNFKPLWVRDPVTNDDALFINVFSSTIDYRSKYAGSYTTTITDSFSAQSGDIFVATSTISGTDIEVNLTITRGGSEVYNATKNWSGRHNTSADFVNGMLCDAGTTNLTVKYLDTYLEGEGFPNSDNRDFSAISGETGASLTRTNIGTTGDTFGTEYKVTATNVAGSTDSNTVDVTETP